MPGRPVRIFDGAFDSLTQLIAQGRWVGAAVVLAALTAAVAALSLAGALPDIAGFHEPLLGQNTRQWAIVLVLV